VRHGVETLKDGEREAQVLKQPSIIEDDDVPMD
jgi:hypothetical protein